MPSHVSRAAVFTLSLTVLALATAPAWAQRTGAAGRAVTQAPLAPRPVAPLPRPSTRGHQDDRVLSAAVRRVERRTGGQVLSAERVPYEGRSLNRIKVVDSSGRVRIYMDDPRQAQPANRPPPPARGRGQRTRGDDS